MTKQTRATRRSMHTGSAKPKPQGCGSANAHSATTSAPPRDQPNGLDDAGTGAILLGVMQVSDDFARRDSPFIIRQRPDGRQGIAAFLVDRSGSLPREAALAFALDADGMVRAETDARDAVLPDGVAVDAVTPVWARQVAEEVMFAILGTPIPDDFVSPGGQTYVPNQPRSGRHRQRNG